MQRTLKIKKDPVSEKQADSPESDVGGCLWICAGPKEGAVKTSRAEAANQHSHPFWLSTQVVCHGVRRWVICGPGNDGWLLLWTFPESNLLQRAPWARAQRQERHPPLDR